VEATDGGETRREMREMREMRKEVRGRKRQNGEAMRRA
jgi:hypothetical protein